MEFFKVIQVFSPTFIMDEVFNEKEVALDAFNEAKGDGIAKQVRLYACEFVNGKLTLTEKLEDYKK